MAKLSEDYSIGLDIGTSSVGWAVVDSDYHIIKYHAKNMWGVRLFEEGQTAAYRRLSRNSRRRLKRRKQRITLLRELIGDVVLKADPNFFVRLDHAFLLEEDKGYKYNLFNDSDFNDADYYNTYKTIYHLRKDLCARKAKADPRLIYLALHHIIKYRGNFLYEGQNFKVSDSNQTLQYLKEALLAIIEKHGLDIVVTEELLHQILQNLMDYTKKKADKKETVLTLLCKTDKDAKKPMTEVLNLLLGYEANLTKLFPDKDIQKEKRDFKTNFDSTKYEDDYSLIETSLQNDFFIMQYLHNVYSFCTLQDILKGKELICDAMIEKYENHQRDLKQLKHFLKENYSLEQYNRVFRDLNVNHNYCNYIKNARMTTREDFYKFINNILLEKESIKDHPVYLSIKDKMERDVYFPRQNSKDNGAIPYQMHELELIKILENQQQFYPQLYENKEKILSIFRFKIPYYIGPLNTHSSFSWIARKDNERLTPWNFEDHVDHIESAEHFIRRMTNKCTYLLAEGVIPKYSLLYSRYETLNELNKIKIRLKNEEKLQFLVPEVKEGILQEVFLHKKKVCADDIRDYLIRHQCYETDKIIEIKGFQQENCFASSLTSWIDFQKIYDRDFEASYDEIEKLIEWITVYEDKRILKKRILQEMPHLKDKLSNIVKLKYSGWGRLSKKLLCGLKISSDDGTRMSIMDYLECKNLNFMQLIHDKKIGFDKLIERENDLEMPNGITYDMVKELQGSPALKKAVWQTVQIVNELVKVMKKEPERIFIEFAREDQESKRTDSKVKKLQNIYAALKKDGVLDAVAAESAAYLSKEDKNKKLSYEKLYLYYLQEGKCMYSGEQLKIHNLHQYQVDHILPQSYIKDDSIDNKALVDANINQYKGDRMLLLYETVKKQKKWWEHLHKYGLISDKKLKNLIRTSLSETEEMTFINRQLVETRQITKHVTNLFKNCYTETDIVAIKAALSSNFREKYNLYKIREINDYHHAQDAYLACMIGTFVMKNYPVLRKEFIFSQYLQIWNINKLLSFRKNGFGFIINQLGNEQIIQKETGELVWDGQKTLNNVFDVFNYKDCFITRKMEEKQGQFFDLTIQKKVQIETALREAPHKVIPVNKERSDVQKYGGFTGLKYAYGIAVEYKIKNKIKRTIFNVPRHLTGNKKALLQYIKAVAETEDVTILKDKILLNQLFETGGGLYTMASASEWNNARQLLLSRNEQETVYLLLNDKAVSDERISAFYDKYLEKLHTYYPLMKGIYEKLKVNKDNFMNSDKKAVIVKELLKITKANPSIGVLKFDDFNISPSAGRINNKTMDLDKTVFVSQSITGLFTKRYQL